jgi:myosin heavy subunit
MDVEENENDAPEEVIEVVETIDASIVTVEESPHVPSITEASLPTPEVSTVKNMAETTKEDARAQVDQMIERKELDEASSSSLQTLFREHEALKDKVSKLKALLGRSAKAQREAKMESEAAHKKLDVALKENQRLSEKIEKLASRSTHMELLADFETNFDRALLSVGHLQQQHQSGGQDTSGAILRVESPIKERNTLDPLAGTAVVDNLLMQELSESKQRVEKLEQLNSSLVHRSAQLESNLNQAKVAMDELLNKIAMLELEKRMAVMEAEQATKAMQEKAASLAEMQMEIDLVQKSAQKAAVRMAEGEHMLKTVHADKMHVQKLESRMKALEEWATASNQAKTLAQERIRILETKLRLYEQSPNEVGAVHDDDETVNGRNADERILDSKKASVVIGAGDVGVQVFELDKDLLQSVNSFTERVILRWTFDLAKEDADISFSVLKGSCVTANERRNADALVKDRLVKGGAGGEIDQAFAIGRACTLVWSNSKSWIKPRTVRYNLEAVVVSD